MEDVRRYLDDYNYGGKEPVFTPYAYPQAGVADDLSDVKMFEEQAHIIRELSQNSPGVFLGRCANFILGNQEYTYSFFIYADDTYREKEGKEYYKGQTLEELKQKDEQRNNYYQKFTGMRRDDPENYDMVVNVAKTGVDGTIDMILEYIRNKEGKEEI